MCVCVCVWHTLSVGPIGVYVCVCVCVWHTLSVGPIGVYVCVCVAHSVSGSKY